MQAGAAIVSLKRLTMFLTLEDRQDEVFAFLSFPADMEDTGFGEYQTFLQQHAWL